MWHACGTRRIANWDEVGLVERREGRHPDSVKRTRPPQDHAGCEACNVQARESNAGQATTIQRVRVIWVHAKCKGRATARLSQVETRVRIPWGLPSQGDLPIRAGQVLFSGCRLVTFQYRPRPLCPMLNARIVHDRRYRGAGGRDSGSEGNNGVIGSTAQSHVREGGARSLSCETHPGSAPQPLP